MRYLLGDNGFLGAEGGTYGPFSSISILTKRSANSSRSTKNPFVYGVDRVDSDCNFWTQSGHVIRSDMAQFIKTGKDKWRVRYAAGLSLNGKRRVLNKTIKGTKQDAKNWAAELEKERSQSGTVKGVPVNEARDYGGWVYAARMCIPNYENCPIKIGYTQRPEARQKTLSACGPFPVEWLGQWRAVSGRFSEIALHERFWRHRLTGEWFFPDPEILAVVEKAIEDEKVKAA